MYWYFTMERMKANPDSFKLDYRKDHFVTDTLRSLPDIRGNVLDFGCGTGEIDIWLARAKKDIYLTGIDFTSNALAIAEKHLLLVILLVRNRRMFVKALSEKRPFPDDAFNACACSHTLEQILSDDEILAELFRFLKSCRNVFFFMPFQHFYDDPNHLWHYFQEQLELHLEPFWINRVGLEESRLPTTYREVDVLEEVKVLCMLRIKNEEKRAIPTLEKASPLVQGCIFLYGGSSDQTPELCRGKPQESRYEYQTGIKVNETRDFNKLLHWALDHDADWILALDGDEILEDISHLVFRAGADDGRHSFHR